VRLRKMVFVQRVAKGGGLRFSHSHSHAAQELSTPKTADRIGV